GRSAPRQAPLVGRRRALSHPRRSDTVSSPMHPTRTSRRRVVWGAFVLVVAVVLVGCSSYAPTTSGTGPSVVGPTTASPPVTPSPETSLLPSVVGKSEASARKTLRRLGFVVAVAKRIVTMDQ